MDTDSESVFRKLCILGRKMKGIRSAAGLVVVGIGNELRRDDGSGLEVVRRIRRVFPGVECLEFSGDAADLIDAWSGREHVLLVDAAIGSDPPGTVLRVDAGRESLKTQSFRLSSHSLGVEQALELSRVLGKLPGDFLIFGIIGRDFGFGKGLSPEAEEGVQESVRRLTREIELRMGEV